MPRHDQVSAAGQLHVRAIDTLFDQTVDLLQEGDGINDHSIADDRNDRRIQHARGNEMQRKPHSIDHERVAGVMAALIAHNHRHLVGELIGDLAFAFITPLGSDDDCCGHRGPPRGRLTAGF
jgi:hypothetical protein